MSRTTSMLAAAAMAVAAWGVVATGVAAEKAVKLPPPTQDVAATAPTDTAVFAGGCFWGVQAVFQHTRGVLNAVSGYAGGDKAGANYDSVSTGRTGHAESVQVTFDPKQVSYGQLLQIYFSVAHDPTTLNRQGPDSGPQYRSAVFYKDADQKRVAESYIAQLDAARAFPARIVTQVAPLAAFYPAEALPPGLRDAASAVALHRHLRPAQDRQPQGDDARPVPRQAGAGGRAGQGLSGGLLRRAPP